VINRLAAATLVALLSAPPLARADAVTRVDVLQSGEVYVVDAELIAAVPLSDAWAVLTDFDGMARFMPNLTESRVLSRHGNRVTVQQKGVARFGVFSRAFESVREMELTASELVRSRQLSGAVRKAESQTRLFGNGNETHVAYHLEMEPGSWLPGLIARAFIKHEVREQFEAIAAEMVRRRTQFGAGAPEAKQ